MKMPRLDCTGKSNLVSIVCFLMLLSTISSQAEQIGWHPDLSLTWGQGLDMRLQGKILPLVATMSSSPIVTDTGDASVAVTFAQSTFDLAKMFSLNSSISARYFVADGSVHFNMVDNQQISQNSLNFTYLCTRNFGVTRYAPVSVSTMLQDYVASRRGKMSSAELQKVVAEQFGTHFVSGVRKEARVMATYSFSFGSQAVRQSYAMDFSARYANGASSATFQTDVRSMLEQKNTSISMSYQLYTSDSVVPWPIAQSGSITNYQQFLDFTTALEKYCQGLSPERGKPVSYVVESVRNIPGFSQLMDCDLSDIAVADYDRYLKVYAKFKAWEDILSGWTMDARRMSWLNTNGQQMVIEMRKDVTAYRKTLDQMAKSHFENSTPLTISDEAFSYLTQLNHIPLPTANVAHHGRYWLGPGDTHYEEMWLCYVHAGPRELTVERPFVNVSLLSNGAEVMPNCNSWETTSPTGVYWDLQEYEATLNSWATNTESHNYALIEFSKYVVNSALWQSLKQRSGNERIGVFVVFVHENAWGSYSEPWMMGLRDATGDFADLWSMGASRATPAMQNLEGSTTADIGVRVMSGPTTGVVGSGYDCVVSVTNSGPGAAYGVMMSSPIAPGFEVASISGSQGAGTCTNGQASYLIGSLANGTEATVRMRLVPLQDGQNQVAGQLDVRIGTGLTNISSSASDAPEPISVQSPQLSLVRDLSGAKAAWTSETSRLILEQSPTLANDASWSMVTEGIESQGTSRTLALTNRSPANFYRLRVK